MLTCIACAAQLRGQVMKFSFVERLKDYKLICCGAERIPLPTEYDGPSLTTTDRDVERGEFCSVLMASYSLNIFWQACLHTCDCPLVILVPSARDWPLCALDLPRFAAVFKSPPSGFGLQFHLFLSGFCFVLNSFADCCISSSPDSTLR